MWSVLVGLIERWWKAQPRADFIRTVLQLRASMQRCQDAFVLYSATEVSDSPRSVQIRAMAAWRGSIFRLVDSVTELNSVIQIFGPATTSALSDYASDEEDCLEDAFAFLEAVASDIGGGPATELVRMTPLAHVQLEGSFNEALKELDRFIASNFKPEEVYAATEGAAKLLRNTLGLRRD